MGRDNKERGLQQIKGVITQLLPGPALIILGNNDVVSPEHGVEMYRQMQQARLMILPGGHGDYIGELATAKPGVTQYPAVAFIEEFLVGPSK